MKCCVCGKEINGYGNNPFPLCAMNDSISRCCDDCNTSVVKARILLHMQPVNYKLAVGDEIAIFYSSNSKLPIECIANNGKFLYGVIEEITTENGKVICKGTWGNFSITADDVVAKVD